MVKRLILLGTFAAGCAAAATVAARHGQTSTRFDSVTELTAVLENVRPNNIVLRPSPAAHDSAVLEQLSRNRPATDAVYAAWARASAVVGRLSRAVHGGNPERAKSFAAVPCGVWRPVGLKAVDGPDGAETRRVRTLCAR